jgi:hydrogenase nickel incorporation protein HypB
MLMGRFHHHADGTVHEHHDLGDHTGYTETGTERLMVLESILAENDRVAALNRADFGRAGVTTINLMSSPGSGRSPGSSRRTTDDFAFAGSSATTRG